MRERRYVYEWSEQKRMIDMRLEQEDDYQCILKQGIHCIINTMLQAKDLQRKCQNCLFSIVQNDYWHTVTVLYVTSPPDGVDED